MFDTKTKAQPILAGLKLAEEVAALKLRCLYSHIGGITVDRLPALKNSGSRAGLQ